MSDLELLFLVIAILYAWECACWLQLGSVGFLTWFGTRWRIAHPWHATGQSARRIHFLSRQCRLWVVWWSDNQFRFHSRRRRSGLWNRGHSAPAAALVAKRNAVRWTDIQSISATGKKASSTAGSASPRFGSRASQLSAPTQALQKLTPEKRPGAIAEIFRASLDTKAFKNVGTISAGAQPR